jgi:transposase
MEIGGKMGLRSQAMVDMDGRALVHIHNQQTFRTAMVGSGLAGVAQSFPLVAKAFADMGYSGDRPQKARLVDVEIVRKPRHRNRIERCFNCLKHFRRFATRYDRQTVHFEGFIHLAAAMIWLR